MDIQIIDTKKRYDIRPSPGEKCVITKTPMELLPKDMVSCDDISCERTKKGMTDNCSLCHIKCQTKYK
jgi:hypothetical protein